MIKDGAVQGMGRRSESEQQEINAEQGNDPEFTEYVLYAHRHTDIQIDDHMPMSCYCITKPGDCDQMILLLFFALLFFFPQILVMVDWLKD